MHRTQRTMSLPKIKIAFLGTPTSCRLAEQPIAVTMRATQHTVRFAAFLVSL